MHRYTMEELDNWSDEQFIRVVLLDRKESLTNSYSPLAQKIDRLLDAMKDFRYDIKKTTNWHD